MAGAEYVRFNVDVGFGTFTPNDNGDFGFKSRAPAEGEVGTSGFEEAQIEHSGKWSPMKVYRRQFPLGAKGVNWGLQATILRRAMEPRLTQPLRVIIAVTLRSLDGNRAVYQEGRRLLEARNWLSQNLSQPVDVQIRT